MRYNIDVHLKKNSTGEERVYNTVHDTEWDCYDGQFYDYIWSEGNFCCDCNRQLFWWRSADEDEYETKCGHEEFTVTKIVDTRTGGIVYRDETPDRDQ